MERKKEKRICLQKSYLEKVGFQLWDVLFLQKALIFDDKLIMLTMDNMGNF